MHSDFFSPKFRYRSHLVIVLTKGAFAYNYIDNINDTDFSPYKVIYTKFFLKKKTYHTMIKLKIKIDIEVPDARYEHINASVREL